MLDPKTFLIYKLQLSALHATKNQLYWIDFEFKLAALIKHVNSRDFGTPISYKVKMQWLFLHKTQK